MLDTVFDFSFLGKIFQATHKFKMIAIFEKAWNESAKINYPSLKITTKGQWNLFKMKSNTERTKREMNRPYAFLNISFTFFVVRWCCIFSRKFLTFMERLPIKASGTAPELRSRIDVGLVPRGTQVRLRLRLTF